MNDRFAMKMRLPVLILLFCLSAFQCAQRKRNGSVPETETSLDHRVLAGNLKHPWELVWGPDQYLWITERYGRVSRVNPATGEVHPLITIGEVSAQGEGGLLGLALHPAFSTEPYVYLAYNYYRNGVYMEKVVRFRYENNTLASPQTLLDGIDASSIHNGCRLLIYENKLFVTTGDASNASTAQDLSTLNGKVLRLNLDGSIPADNPFPGKAIWTYGHRNAQGLTNVDGKLFISEHGPDSDDEINILQKGSNYGWPEVKGFCNTSDEQSFCSAHSVKEPIKAWTPTAAVCGLAYYNSSTIPSWKNSLLLATLKNSRLYQLRLNDSRTEITGTTEFFTQEYGRLRGICVSPQGKVYFSTSNGHDDQIIVVGPK